MISRLIRKLQHRLSCIAGWTKNMEEKKYKAIIEGILFSMGESVELEKIAGALGLDQKKTKELIDEMRNEWEEQKRGVTITELDGAYQMCTISPSSRKSTETWHCLVLFVSSSLLRKKT